MSNEDKPIDPFQRGDRPGASRFNELVSQINDIAREVTSLQRRFEVDKRQQIAVVESTNPVEGATQRHVGKIMQVHANPDPGTSVAAEDIGTLPEEEDCEIWDLAEFDVPGLITGVFIGTKTDGTPIFLQQDNRAIRKIRYFLPRHNLQVSYAAKANYSDDDFEDAVQFQACTPAGVLGRPGDYAAVMAFISPFQPSGVAA